ncbi:MAG: ribulose-phosphate 3-epimerase [Candidatus Azotimanducaceae bacterium]|jgi:ribulose-phosphate 3-epimerase
MISIVPSLPAASFEEIHSLAWALRGCVPELQIDIVDNKFVPAISWPFTEVNPLEDLKRLKEIVEQFDIEMDCMVEKPEQYLDAFVALGVARVIVHMGSTEVYEDIIAHARTHGYKIGLAFTNDVPISEVEKYVEKIDFVQIMGIVHVGKQGQPFDQRTLETAKTLRSHYPELQIAVDGSVNADTIKSLYDAGVNRFAPGSAIAKQDDPKAAYAHLKSLVTE